jgi:hypothetical protein
MVDEQRDPQDAAATLAEEVLQQWRDSNRDWELTVTQMMEAAQKARDRHAMAMRLRDAITTDGGQLPLPGAVPEPKPRKKRRVMMHVAQGAQVFCCPKCDETAPVPDDASRWQRMSGIPCPRCNAELEGDQ